MKKLQFSIDINAPKEKVWKALWEETNYRNWTSAFTEGSHAETDNWKEGSKVKFLDGKGSGMYSTIVKNTPNEFMSFRHEGEIINGNETPKAEWNGAMENYILKDNGAGKTKLIVDLNSAAEFGDYMNETFPKALEKVKALAEKI